MDLSRRPVGILKVLDAGRDVRVSEALNIESVERVDIHAEFPAFRQVEDFIKRNVGLEVLRTLQNRRRVWVHTGGKVRGVDGGRRIAQSEQTSRS